MTIKTFGLAKIAQLDTTLQIMESLVNQSQHVTVLDNTRVLLLTAMHANNVQQDTK